MTGRTQRQYRRRAHYPARINFGVTAELRAALEALADKADTCVAEVAQRTKGRRTVKQRRRTREQLDTLDEQLIEVLRADRPQSVRHLFYRITDGLRSRWTKRSTDTG